MGILEDTISQFKTNTNVEKMMQLCSMITEEETPNIKHPDKLPYGPNIFLSIEVTPQRKTQINYLILEREDEDTWIIILYTMLKKKYEIEDEYPKRAKIFEIKDHRPAKIVTAFAKKIKFYRGE